MMGLDENHNRRSFLQKIGVLAIGFSMSGISCLRSENTVFADLPPMQPLELDPKQIDSWLLLRENGRVTIRTGKMELGQGITTAIAQVAAEELNMDINAIDMHLAETGYTADEGYTAGSMSMQTSAMSVRIAAASAREHILLLAAKELRVPKAELELENGQIRHGSQSTPLYKFLEGKRIEASLIEDVPLYSISRRKLVGKSLGREDIRRMVSAESHFIHDLRFPGMVHARIVRPPAQRARLQSMDTDAIKQLTDLTQLVRIGNLVGVIAVQEYDAIKLSKSVATHLQWEYKKELPPQDQLGAHIKSLSMDSETDKETDGWSDRILSQAPISHQAAYFKPYIMHAANGPSCAIAYYESGKLWVWTHSQGVYPLRAALADLLKMNEDAIHVKGVPGSGCYGHNGADDVAAEAALLATKYSGKHIRLQWMREEENAWEPYGTAMMMELKAGLSTDGRILGWQYDLYSDAHGVRPGGNAYNLLPAWHIEKGHGDSKPGSRGGATRNADPYYHIPHQSIRSHIFRGPLRRSSLRGLGAYANVFALESFMDELAEKANIDPINFRLNHLTDDRAKDCLRQLARSISAVSVGRGEGMGIAFARYKNAASYCAVAAHIGYDEQREEIVVRKLWAVVDAGEIINPDGIKNQVEGGMVQSASWTLMEEVQFDDTHVTNLDWDSYPILRFQDAPAIQVELIDRPAEKPMGVGETAQGPTAAALANALYRASGKRVRELPLRKYL